MRRWYSIGAAVLVILAGVVIGVGAYNAGLNQGLERTGDAVQVVRYVGPGFGFPFGLILFPLFLFGIFALARGAFWRRHWDGGPHGWQGSMRPGGPRGGGEPAAFEDWHRHLHEQSDEHRDAGGAGAG
jgi:hypothetical protein